MPERALLRAMKLIARISAISSLLCVSLLAADVLTVRPLFNGQDLSGWKGDGYVVEDGNLVCTPQGKVLMTDGIFANYVLDFEFQLTPGANNGLGIHYPGTGDAALTGMEIQILDDSHPKHAGREEDRYHGSLYKLAAAKRGALKPAGEWNQQRVTVMGAFVKVELNNQLILRANLDDLQGSHPQHNGLKRRAGHIAFLGHGDRVAFRKIHIGELPPVANEEGVQAAGFTRIFDGKSLKGWKHTPDTTNWHAAHGILKHNGREGAINDLWTEKSYRDFMLVCDWRWSGRGPQQTRPLVNADGSEQGSVEIEEQDSGIFLRGQTKSQVNLWNWPVGSGEVYGYRIDAAMPAEVRAAVTPKIHADRPLGEWNRMMITLKGERLTVSLNGRVVIDNAELPGIPAEGPIGLQHHGSAIDFANLWIKEL
jgi:hypothetical protein